MVVWFWLPMKTTGTGRPQQKTHPDIQGIGDLVGKGNLLASSLA